MSVNDLVEKSELDGQLDELQPGTTLLHGQYTITRFLNNGGFGITYLAKDSLDRDVVIKECFADAFCRRTKTIVSARSRAHQNELKSIIRHFIQEARSLSKLRHPNIVGVHQVFEDNDTAYMAIDFVDGRDLMDVVEDANSKLAPEQIVDMTRKLLSAIGYVHEHGMLHRDISPDNILVNQQGEPILIDFGAARESETTTGRKHSALRVVKDGYSPQEFYIAGSEQGPWSDLYALAASLYHTISGEAPVNGQARLAAIAEQRPDPYVPLAGRIEGYPKGFLEAIDKAMITKPALRVQSADEWLAMLDGKVAVDGNPDEAISRLLTETVARAEDETESDDGARDQSLPDAKSTEFAPFSMDETAPATGRAAPKSRGMLMAVSGLALLAVLGVAGYSMVGDEAPATGEQTAEVAAMAPATGTSDSDGTSVASTVGAGAAADEKAAAEEAAAEQAAAEQAAAEQAAAEKAAAEQAAAEQAAAEQAAAEQAAAEQAAAEKAAAEQAAAEQAAAEQAAAEQAAAEQAAAEQAAAEQAAAEKAAAEQAAAEQAAAEKAAAEQAAAEQAAAEQAAADQAAAEQAAAELAAAEAAAKPDLSLPLVEAQVSFALWDIAIPFEFSQNTVRNAEVALITNVPSEINHAVSGDWIAEGTEIYTVNDRPLSKELPFETQILNALVVDPDGYTRATVRFKNPVNQRFERGLIAVPVVRRMGLADGTLLDMQMIDDVWTATITEIPTAREGGLQVGDVLVSEATTGQSIDSVDALGSVMAELVKSDAAMAKFEVLRGGNSTTAEVYLTRQ
ncbi:serine/threonine protein kinase [Defluviimonas sp. WL0050]|uniref:non-specific serine/threonine protein kinase n=1 Tax=Albidovulum litorale TaxID=2984134 RepID=A0ABT2ZTJ6_9RHOB|nr:serine/threonine-protein kinase [Defluviimonas sp. WL0050]MCV2874342.1 serine/threonine protein kinase [Defluviimonas sp. WL0050]